jgi:TPR repeat protein
LLTPADEQSILQLLPKFQCPFKRAKNVRVKLNSSQLKRTIEDEFKDFKNFVDPGYQQYERYFDNRYVYTSSSNVYNVHNDGKSEATKQKPRKDSTAKTDDLEKADEEDAAIDSAIRELAHIVGELEFQMGIDSVMTGNFNEAADHFKLSTNHNHPGGIFNLAICYEQGTGVKKNLKTARALYEIASRLGHAKALYNLGVFHAQGLGGANKDSRQAKQYFQQAADLGNNEAAEALRLFLPKPKIQTLKPKKLPIIKEFPEDEFYFKDKIMSKAVSAIAMNQMMRRVAA